MVEEISGNHLPEKRECQRQVLLTAKTWHNNEPNGPSADLVIMDHLHEAIGLTIDNKNKRIYVSDLLGSIYSVDMDGKNKKIIVADKGNFTGLCFVPAFSQ